MTQARTTWRRAEVMRLYDDGASIADIADWLGQPRGLVRRIIEEEGLKRAKAAKQARVPAPLPTLSPVLELALCRPWRRA